MGVVEKLRPFTFQDMARLGTDEKGNLCLDGKPIEVKKKLTFRWWQTVLAAMTACGALLSGVASILFWLKVPPPW